MSVIESVFEKLAGRVRQRTTTAWERLETAAKTFAAGQTVDIAGLEDDLFTTSQKPEDFRSLVDLFSARRDNLAKTETLSSSRLRVQKLDEQIDAENAKYAEITEAYRRRYVSLREQANAAQAEVDEAQRSRDWLLELKNCPPSLRGDYEAALAQEKTAQEQVSAAERETSRLEREIKSKARDIEELLAPLDKEIHPIPAVITKSGRDALSAANQEKLELAEKRKARYERELVEAKAALDAARKSLAAAEAAVADIQKRIVKA